MRQVGANGQLSRYPFGAAAAEGVRWYRHGDATYYRAGCQPRTRELFLACDIGFAPVLDGRFPFLRSISRRRWFLQVLARLL